MTCLRALLLGLILIFSFAPSSFGGRRPYLFTWDAETIAEGDIELEQWIWVEGNKPVTHASVGWIWFSPVYGVTNQLEIATPWELSFSKELTTLTNLTVEARYRLTDPNESSAFVTPLIRVFYQVNFNRPMGHPLGDRGWLGTNLVLAFGNVKGSHATLDVGGFLDSGFGESKLIVQTLGAAFARQLTPELRGGIEYYHEIFLENYGSPSPKKPYLGPTLSFSRGPLWTNLGVIVGLGADASAYIARFIFGASL